MRNADIRAVLGEISFEDGPVQVVSLQPEGTDIEFPLTEGPINFSVLSDRGLSVRWGVKIGRNGDAYICNRDVANAEKVSLHASGNQHISITAETAIRVGASSRFGPRWMEPAFGRRAVPTFSILFPPWGVADRRPENLARGRGELLIVGHMEKITVAGFFITDAGSKLLVDAPHFVLGKLALRPGRLLHVVAWKEPENNLRALLRASFRQARSALHEASDLVVDFQGFRAPNSAFMVAVPAMSLR